MSAVSAQKSKACISTVIHALNRFLCQPHQRSSTALYERYEECARRDQQVVVPESRQRFLKDPYHKERFTYDEQSDSFTCPQGQTLKFVRIQHANGVPLRLYRASGVVCQVCPAF